MTTTEILIRIGLIFLFPTLLYAQTEQATSPIDGTAQHTKITEGSKATIDVTPSLSGTIEAIGVAFGSKPNSIKAKLHLGLNEPTLMSNSSDSKSFIRSLGRSLLLKNGGTIMFDLSQTFDTNFTKKVKGIYGWNLNFTSIPFKNALSESDDLTLINKLNVTVNGAFNIKIPYYGKTSKHDKKIEKEKLGDILLSINCLVSFSTILHGYDHTYFTIFQDEYGNKARRNSIVYNFELSAQMKATRVTFGYVGRRSLSYLNDASIFGLQPRAYFSLERGLKGN